MRLATDPGPEGTPLGSGSERLIPQKAAFPRPKLTCISHRTLRFALWRRLFSLPRRLSSRRMEREPLPQHVSARVPRRQPKRLRHEQLAQCRLKGDEKSGLTGPCLRSGLATAPYVAGDFNTVVSCHPWSHSGRRPAFFNWPTR